MKKILITGGAGFVASALAEKLIQDSENFVVIADNLLTGSTSKLPSSKYNNWRFIKCDVNDYKDISAIFFSHGFDYVFHYAAVVGVKRTLDNPIMVLRDLQGFENILKLCKNTHVKRIFFSSSSEVYGEPVEFPQKELTTPLNSRLPYAVVKNIGEAFLRSYKQEYDLDFTIFRFFNTYGPKQSQDFVMSKFINAALNNKDITIYGDGSQTRTFCYIDDNVDACYNAFRNNLCVNDVANIGSDLEISILELAELIIDITGSASKIVHLPPLEDGDMKRRKPDNTLMRKLLNRELTPLRTGISKVIEIGSFINQSISNF
jgi:nucleoside-diphosphate-sugar epimerase